MSRQIRVVSEGTPTSTKIYTPSGKEFLGLVQKMVITVDANDPFVRANIELILPEFDMKIDADKAEFEIKEIGKDDDSPSS